ncbi:little elongation complex subunit 2 [Drosophila kikkawai]|uniref:Little elongation complex subunit 2 n=1 Tax=Drosophila kikkawai TaxID=30033 RepID=A0A6P4J705_DROKI|nr:little elongation complex subunit 2 [Drosophila kikkawai]
MDPNLYQGNAIFRNQPSYKAFNKSFEHVDDALYTFLNEVDPEVLRLELKEPSEVFTSFKLNTAPKDPRTNEVPRTCVCDHTISRTEPRYSFPNPLGHFSELNLQQQAACMRVLLAWQQGAAVAEDDFVIWHATEKKRCNEQQRVQKYIHDYEQSQREVLYIPMKRLVTIYRQLYELSLKKLMKKYANESYVTFSGLPQLSQCKSLNSQTVSIEEVELERVVGRTRIWPGKELRSDSVMRNLNVRLDRYSGKEPKDSPTLLRDEEKNQEALGGNVVVLPLDSLLMLLTSGSYVDMSAEMFVSIGESTGAGHKYIEFYTPFPARNCGWHTNSLVLKKAYEAYISQPGQARWLNSDPNGATREITDPVDIDMTASSINLQTDFKPLLVGELSSDILDTSANAALVSWCLRCKGSNGEDIGEFQVFSTLTIAAMIDDHGKQQPLGCHLIKMENKPDCGCEIMSKYELISAWLQLKLLHAEVGHCTRISLRDFEPMLEEKLTLISLEQQLHDYYNTSMPQLLSNLYEFLQLLCSVPAGTFLLRHSPKYKDKFLLCKATKEATAQSFLLHQLLTESPPSDLNFLTQGSYLPISPTLCGRLHEELHLLPCAFPPKADGRAVKRRGTAVLPRTEPTKRVLPRRQPVHMGKTSAQRENIRHTCKTAQKRRARARKIAAAKEEKAQLDKFMSL